MSNGGVVERALFKLRMLENQGYPEVSEAISLIDVLANTVVNQRREIDEFREVVTSHKLAKAEKLLQDAGVHVRTVLIVEDTDWIVKCLQKTED